MLHSLFRSGESSGFQWSALFLLWQCGHSSIFQFLPVKQGLFVTSSPTNGLWKSWYTYHCSTKRAVTSSNKPFLILSNKPRTEGFVHVRLGFTRKGISRGNKVMSRCALEVRVKDRTHAIIINPWFWLQSYNYVSCYGNISDCVHVMICMFYLHQ